MAQSNPVRLDIKGGMNTYLSPDLLPDGSYPYLANVRKYLSGRTVARAPLGDNLLPSAVASGPTSLIRLNDGTPAGPPSGFALIEGADGSMYLNSTRIATGLTGQPLSFVTFRPNATPQPWCYTADNTASGVSLTTTDLQTGAPVTAPSNGMNKVRSDGTIWHTGIAEPQTAPNVTFVGGGSGVAQIFYRTVYRSSATGAISNPSPESISGTNSQSGPSATVHASEFATKITFNAAQYEFVDTLLRTTGSVGPGVVTDYVVAHNFGLSIPNNVNIDGIQTDLNWFGQNAGTGVLSGVSLFYLGQPLGTAKFPGIQNQSFNVDTLQGGNADTWGATLTPAIINDNSFGFGVQITTQLSGGSDRSFLFYFTITVYYSTQDATVVPSPSTDPQVDKIDIYRQGGALADFTYVGTGPNDTTPFVDQLGDLSAVANPVISFSNYEPFPSIDMPQKGVVNVASGAVAGTMQVTWVSGDQFSIRWLPGTDIVIAGIAYVFYNRPTGPTQVTVILQAGQLLPTTTTNLEYEIAEPDLAAQPSPAIWGPTPDNGGAFYFGLDPLNTGDLVWSAGNNFDAAPDTNRLNVTSASEILMNGVITSELSAVFSTERFWLIYPNFADAISTITGVTGPQWTLIQSAATRGLYMRYAINALGAMIAWRAKDCICISMGGGPEQSITDSIYNLFPHEGFSPSPVTIGEFTVFPPDDMKPNAQTITVAPGYIFYNYQDVFANQHTLVYDIAAKGWSVDSYTPPVNCHVWAVGQVDQLLTGCRDGTVRQLISGGSEVGTAVIATRSENGGSSRVVKRIGGWFLRAMATTAITIAYYRNRFQQEITGFNPSTVTGVSEVEQDFLIDFTQSATADVLDVGMVVSWPIGSENILSEYQPDWQVLPEQIIGYKTGLLSYGNKGWMHIPWINLAYQSTAAVTLVLTPDFGSPITLSFPSTSGVHVKQFMTLPQNKFKICGWTANSTLPFTIYAQDCEAFVCSWGIASQNLNPFGSFGSPGASN